MEWGKFWKLWIQKILRNIASMKFQWLMLLYAPVVWGMLNGKWIEVGVGAEKTTIWIPYINAALGLGFLGGGFITLAVSRIYAKTQLNGEANYDENLDTDQ